MKNKIIYIFFLCCFFSCTTDIQLPVSYIGDDVLSHSSQCEVKVMDVNDSIYSGSNDFFVYNDSILIITKKNPTDGYFIEVRRLENKEILAQFFHKGNGHSELLSANVDMNKNILFVNDYVKSKFSFINIDSVITNKDYQCILRSKKMTLSPTVVPYYNNYLIENPYCYCDSNINVYQGIEQGVPRFYVIEDGKENDEKDDYEFNPRSVAVDGRIACDLKNKNLVYAHFGRSIVEFYDSTLTLKKMLKGPKNMNVTYGSYDNNGNKQKQIIYKSRVPYSYLGYCCDDNYVYLMYIGDFFVNDSDIQKMTTYILKFDWDGNFQKSYHIGAYLSSISKGKEMDTFYATTINQNGERILIKIN